jgi:putative effector of murein hydrolase
LTPLRDIEVIGDMILARLPFASAIARGALFGVGANGAGTARAHFEQGQNFRYWPMVLIKSSIGGPGC